MLGNWLLIEIVNEKFYNSNRPGVWDAHVKKSIVKFRSNIVDSTANSIHLSIRFTVVNSAFWIIGRVYSLYNDDAWWVKNCGNWHAGALYLCPLLRYVLRYILICIRLSIFTWIFRFFVRNYVTFVR